MDYPMLSRARAEDGFLMIEVMVAMLVLTIALLALMAGYDSAFVSLHNASEKAVASKLANQQLELYTALPFASIGLDQTTTDAVGNPANGAYDSLYATSDLLSGDFVTDPDTGDVTQNPSGTVNDVEISGCGSAANCLPIQVVTGSDNRQYRIETFIRDEANSPSIRWTERVVTVIVRDQKTMTELVEMSTAFDRGPSS
jgi:type II secretory pathway pseudopilin PulG